MPYFDNEGIKIYYEIEGEGPPVVMIHGFSSNFHINLISVQPMLIIISHNPVFMTL